MALENKLGISDSAELAREEERISKKKAAELYDSGYLDSLTPGIWATLAEIHRYLFEDIYDFVVRDEDLSFGLVVAKVAKVDKERKDVVPACHACHVVLISGEGDRQMRSVHQLGDSFLQPVKVHADIFREGLVGLRVVPIVLELA